MIPSLELQQRMTQRLSQQQLRFVRLLELTAPEMEEAVEKELEANPALTALDETPAPSPNDSEATGNHQQPSNSDTFTPRYYQGHDPDEYSNRPEFAPRDDSESLADVLQHQIDQQHASPQVSQLASYIIGNLDNNGWLTRSLPLMMTDMAVNYGIDAPKAEWEKAYEMVRGLEPAGVGAESLADCLTLQLRRLPDSEAKRDALDILTRYFEEYHKRHGHKIISGLKISQKRLDAANKLILSLNPKPGASFGGNEATTAAIVIPDFIISERDGQLYIRLNNRTPDLAIEESFRSAAARLEGLKGKDRKGNEFILSNFNEARDFISIVRQRQETLLNVMTAIAKYQQQYFDTGDIYTLRPMQLKDIAAMTGLDLSVISRATNNKYVAMPWGEVLPLRTFFSGQVNAPAPGHAATDAEKGSGDEGLERGDELTNLQIQTAIKELVEKEDSRHPLSDAKLREALAEKGYDISRRTVAKYRDRAGIAIARMRKKL